MYCSRVGIGILKFIFFLAFCATSCVFQSQKPGGVGFSGLNSNFQTLFILLICGCLGAMAWQITDIVFFASNSYKDGYGVPLNPW
jgi:hypothetical protein